VEEVFQAVAAAGFDGIAHLAPDRGA